VLRDELRVQRSLRIVTVDFNEPRFTRGQPSVRSWAWTQSTDGELRLRRTWTRHGVTRPGKDWDDAVT
jgi:hypothetical protein